MSYETQNRAAFGLVSQADVDALRAQYDAVFGYPTADGATLTCSYAVQAGAVFGLFMSDVMASIAGKVIALPPGVAIASVPPTATVILPVAAARRVNAKGPPP